MTIDQLEIEIVAETSKATESMNALVAALTNAKTAASKGLGLGRVLKDVTSINKAFEGLREIKLPEIKDIDMPAGVKNIEKEMEDIWNNINQKTAKPLDFKTPDFQPIEHDFRAVWDTIIQESETPIAVNVDLQKTRQLEIPEAKVMSIIMPDVPSIKIKDLILPEANIPDIKEARVKEIILPDAPNIPSVDVKDIILPRAPNIDQISVKKIMLPNILDIDDVKVKKIILPTEMNLPDIPELKVSNILLPNIPKLPEQDITANFKGIEEGFQRVWGNIQKEAAEIAPKFKMPDIDFSKIQQALPTDLKVSILPDIQPMDFSKIDATVPIRFDVPDLPKIEMPEIDVSSAPIQVLSGDFAQLNNSIFTVKEALALINNTATEAFSALRQGVRNMAKELHELELDRLSKSISNTFAPLDNMLQGMEGKISGMANTIAAPFEAAKAKLNDFFGPIIKDFEKVKAAFSTIGSEIKELGRAVGTIGSAIKTTLSSAFSPLITVVSKIVETVKNIGNTIIPVFKKIGDIAIPIFTKIGSVIGGAFKGVGNIVGSLAQRIASIASTFAKLAIGVTILRKLQDLFKNLTKHASLFNGGLIRAFARIIYYRTIRRLIFQVTEAFRTGIQNIAKYSSDTQAAMSSLITDTLYLKNALGSVAAPIINILAPAFRVLTDAIVSVLNAIGMLTAALTGSGTFVKAKRDAQEYGKALGGAAKAQDNLLGGLDELNIISDKALGGAGGIDVSGMFETVEVPGFFKDLADAIKSLDPDVFYDFGKKIGESMRDALDKIPWSEIQAKGKQVATLLASTINGFVEDAQNWVALGKTLGQGINTALGTVNTFFEKTNFMAIGKGIATLLNEAMDVIEPGVIGKFLSNKLNAAIDAAYGFVTTFDFKRFGTFITGEVNAWFQNIHAEEAGRAFFGAIKGILDFAITTLETMPWGLIGDKIKEFISGIDWNGIGKGIGALFGLSITGANDLMDSIINIISGMKWSDIGKAFGGKLSEIFSGDEISKIFTTLLSAIKTGFSSIIDFISGITEGLGFSNLSDAFVKLKQTVEPIIDKLGPALSSFYEKILKPFFTWTLNSAVPSFFNLLSTAVSGLLKIIVAFQPTGEWLWTNFLKPIASWTGGAIVSLIDSLSNALKFLSDHASTLLKVIVPLTAAFVAYKAALAITSLISTLSTALQGLSIAQGLVTVAQYALNLAMSLNPIALIVAAIVGLVAGIMHLWNTSEGFRDVVMKIGGEIMKFFTETLPNSFADTVAFIGEKVENVKSFFTKTLPNAVKLFVDKFDEKFGLIKGIVDGVKQQFEGLINFIAGVFTGDWDRAWSGIREVFKGIFNSIISVLEGAMNSIVKGINGVIGGLNNFSIDIPEWVNYIVPGVGGKKFGINITKLTEITIPRFAEGGFPERGDLFWANEDNRPEMVGTMGNRTAVANTDQIIAGISEGVAEANESQNNLLIEQNELLRAILAKTGVFIDSEEIWQGQRRLNSQKGFQVMGGGVVYGT